MMQSLIFLEKQGFSTEIGPENAKNRGKTMYFKHQI